MDLSLFFAGTAGSVPTARRGLPALLLRAGGDRILFDCGEGTQQQLLRSVGLPELDAIFLTHYHLDHWLGIIGHAQDVRPARARAAADRLRPARPAGAARRDAPGVGQGRPTRSRSRSSTRTTRSRFDGYAIAPFPVEHRVRAYGYAFAEDDRPGRFDAETAARARRHARPRLRPPAGGRDRQRRARPSRCWASRGRGRRIVFSGDTAPCQATEVFAHEADLLVHEATFLDDELARARETGHSTARQAAEVAAAAGVRLLALTHLSTRYFPRDIRDEARAVFPRHARPARLRHHRGAVPRARASPHLRQGGHPRTDMSTIAFFPEGAYGPTNNCVGIGDILRRRGHRVVFIVEESFAGALEAQGFEERLMRLAPPPRSPRSPASSGRTSSARRRRVPQADDRAARRRSSPRPSRRWSTAPATSTSACARSSASSSPT